MGKEKSKPRPRQKAKPDPTSKSPVTGRWRIVEMSAWDDESLDEEVEAYCEFDENGGGSFQFGYIQGRLDCRTTRRDGKPAIEFSWEGGDGADGTPLTGRGWAILQDDELKGLFCIHDGDDSEFRARRPGSPAPAPAPAPKPPRSSRKARSSPKPRPKAPKKHNREGGGGVMGNLPRKLSEILKEMAERLLRDPLAVPSPEALNVALLLANEAGNESVGLVNAR